MKTLIDWPDCEHIDKPSFGYTDCESLFKNRKTPEIELVYKLRGAHASVPSLVFIKDVNMDHCVSLRITPFRNAAIFFGDWRLSRFSHSRITAYPP